MKKLFLFLLLYGFIVETLSHRNLVASALSQIVRDFYHVQNDQFDLVVSGHESRELNEIVNQLGKLGQENFPPLTVVDAKRVVNGIYRSAILLFDNLRSYRDFHPEGTTYTNEYARQFHMLVYILHVSESQASKLILFKSVPVNDLFHYESFLVHTDSDDSIKLITFAMFQQPNCRAWNAIEVNRFSIATRKWDHQEFFPDKFSNFDGCLLVVHIYYPISPVIHEGTSKDKEPAFGYPIDFFREAARNLNFRMYSQFIDRYKMPYKSWLPPRDLAIIPKITRFLKKVYRNDVFTTEYFTTQDEVFLISRFKPYSQMEKLTFAFEKEVWHWLLATLIVALVVIVVIKFLPSVIQRFVFGTHVRTPMMNLAIVFFGGGMIVLPGRNFARFILALYIMFCLIVRTAYQGKQFEFLHKEVRPADVKSIDEMIEKNFTFFMTPGLLEETQIMEFASRARIETITLADYYDIVAGQIIELLKEGSNRGVLFLDEQIQEMMKHWPEKVLFSKLQEKLMSDYFGFPLERNHFMLLSLNRKVVQFTESGLAKVFVDRYRTTKKPAGKSGPKVLTLDHLYAGFYVWLVCVAFAIFVFILEIPIGKLSSMFWETAFRF